MILPPRLLDWEARFAQFQIDCAARGFVRGEHDCALYIARGGRAILGIDYASQFLGRYKDLRGAVRTLREFGAGDLEATVAAFAPKLAPGERPRVGDIAIVQRPGGKNTGFFTEGGLSLVSNSGLVFVAKDQAISAYKVGK